MFTHCPTNLWKKVNHKVPSLSHQFMEEHKSLTMFSPCTTNLWKKVNHTQFSLTVPSIYGRKQTTHKYACSGWAGARKTTTCTVTGKKKRRKKKKQYNTEIVYILTYKPSPQITLSFSSVSLSFLFFFSLLFFFGGGGEGSLQSVGRHKPSLP